MWWLNATETLSEREKFLQGILVHDFHLLDVVQYQQLSVHLNQSGAVEDVLLVVLEPGYDTSHHPTSHTKRLVQSVVQSDYYVEHSVHIHVMFSLADKILFHIRSF